jgi:tetratricopeptide (TPR) repeat protein
VRKPAFAPVGLVQERRPLYTRTMPNETQNSVLDQALQASAADDAQRAIELFRLACTNAPSDPVPYFLLGAELAQARHYADAEDAYASAVALAPRFAIARYELGTLQFTSSRVPVALVTWQPLMDLPEGDPLKLFVQGYGALAQDRLQEALGFFRDGIAANQSNAALNANIRMLIEEIEKAARVDNAPTSNAPQETAGAHVLLDAYRRQGSMR